MFLGPKASQERQDGSKNGSRCLPKWNQQQITKLKIFISILQLLEAISSHFRSHFDAHGEALGPKNFEKLNV